MSPDSRQDIVLVISDLSLGGAQRVVTLLANAWAKQGFKVQVSTFFGKERDHFILPDNISRVVMRDPGESQNVIQGILANVNRIMRLRRMLRSSDAPVVISFIGVTNILVVLAGIGAPWRTIISERNDPARQSLGRVWDALRRWLYRHADMVTANSSGAIATLANFVPTQKLALVHNPIDIEHYNNNAESRTRTVLAIGRMVPQKAFDVLLDAFAKAGDQLSDWELIMIGEGPLVSQLQNQADKLEISARVRWMGRIDNCAPLYAAASIFALPSRYEGVPNALLEAMASGCPVIISNASSGPLDYVVDGESGLVVQVEDVDMLARAMECLAGDEELRQRLGMAARTRITLNASEHVVGEWSRLIGLGGCQGE